MMLSIWTLIPLVTATCIVVLALLLWRMRGLRVTRSVFISAIAGLVVFLILFVLQRSFGDVQTAAPIQQQLLLILGVVLTINASVELAKWAIIEAAVRPKRVRIPQFLLDLMGWIVLLAASLLALSGIFNLDLSGLLVGSTVVSAIIALSLQQILGSLFAGIALQLDGPFQVDDWVEVDGQEGQVLRMSWRTLTIMTRRNECIILPNNQVAQNKIINYSRPQPMVACDLLVGISRIHPPNQVKAVLHNAFIGIEGLAPAQAPQIMIVEYADSAINYGIRYWFHDYGLRLKLHDDVLTRAWYALRRAEISIAVPIRDVTMHMIGDDHQQVVTVAAQHQIRNALRPVALFEVLTSEQLNQIAASARLQAYTAGEALVHEGQAGDSLFIIKSGQVNVYVAGADNGRVLVAQRGAGDYFGEMSLLTGAPRSASVVAAVETEVVLIDKYAFTNVLAADPSILEALLDALDTRRSAVETRLAEESARSRQIQDQERTTLVQRIGTFLGLKLAGNKQPVESL